LGYLPAQALSEEANNLNEPGLEDFKENHKFLDLLHCSIKQALTEGSDDYIKAKAAQRVEGWLHIHDERNIPPFGRVGDPDDIVASVRVHDGEIDVSTYQPMPAYRLCTRDGPTLLSEGLNRKLQENLTQEEERETI
jgi:hypothetical protein